MPESTDVKIETVPDLEAPRIEDDDDDDSDDTIPDLEDAGKSIHTNFWVIFEFI